MTALGKGNKWSGRQRRPWEDSLAMPRRPRRTCWTDAACYHVMNRGQNRATIFADDNDRHYFLGLAAGAVVTTKTRIGTWLVGRYNSLRYNNRIYLPGAGVE